MASEVEHCELRGLGEHREPPSATNVFGVFLGQELLLVERKMCSINADGPHDAAAHKIDHIALPTKYNYQATSIG